MSEEDSDTESDYKEDNKDNLENVDWWLGINILYISCVLLLVYWKPSVDKYNNYVHRVILRNKYSPNHILF